MLYYVVLCWVLLRDAVIHCTVALHCVVLYCFVLRCVVLNVLRRNALYGIAGCCNVYDNRIALCSFGMCKAVSYYVLRRCAVVCFVVMLCIVQFLMVLYGMVWYGGVLPCIGL